MFVKSPTPLWPSALWLLLSLNACGPDSEYEPGPYYGGVPSIMIEPNGLKFSSTKLGQENQKTLTITNTTEGTLHIKHIALREGDEDREGELIKGDRWPNQAKLKGLESISFTVKWVPVNNTPDTAIITVDSNDPLAPIAKVAVQTTPPGRAY